MVTIDYNWGEINVTSRTRYLDSNQHCCAPTMAFAEMDIEPEDIDAEDSATFVWEII